MFAELRYRWRALHAGGGVDNLCPPVFDNTPTRIKGLKALVALMELRQNHNGRTPRFLERFSIVLNRDVLVEDSQIGWNERFCAG
jgi:hypothetical protein